MKTLYIYIVLIFAPVFAFAQQQGQFSQYMQNYYLINPAISGTEDYAEIRTGYRLQWLGIEGSPSNHYISASTPIGKVNKQRNRSLKSSLAPHHAVGVLVNGQSIGAFRHNGIYASYNYHLPITSKYTVSMAFAPGIRFFSLNQNRLDFGSDDLVDPAAAVNNQLKPDLNAGAFLYSDNLFFGISSMQMLRNRLSFSLINPESGGFMNRHYFVTGGYKFKVNREVSVIPSLLVKTVLPTALQVDVNCKVRYKDLLWAGASYRHKDAVLVMVGMVVNGSLEVGYSYDYTTSGLSTVSGGSHELTLGLRLPTNTNRVLCPNQFW